MGIKMPAPVKIGDTFYYRVRIPADLRGKVEGTKIIVSVDGVARQLTVNEWVKVSLGTKDWLEAKRRFQLVSAQVEARWQAERNGPQRLTHLETVALAGELYRLWVHIFHNDPGSPDLWERMREADAYALEPRLHPLATLMVNPRPSNRYALEQRYGGFVDVQLRKHGKVIDDESRHRLLEQVARALDDAARINRQKALGDYSEDGETKKYPEMPRKADAAVRPATAPVRVTFGGIIDEEIRRRNKGRSGKPFRDHSVIKYRRVADEFVAFRGSEFVETVTPKEADDWIMELLEAGEISNSTIKQRLGNLKTIVEWGRKQSLGSLFPDYHPLQNVPPPSVSDEVPEGERAFKLDEARAVLEAARKEAKPDLRWLPWMCAYSGARINEVAQLRPVDFKVTEGVHFYHLSTMGRRTLKNETSQRRVPIHPDLIKEGLLDFVATMMVQPEVRLFSQRAQGNVRDWVREELGLTRQHLSPNHGWRHLFEDRARGAGLGDAVRRYLTGRADGRSEQKYGGSEAAVPGLAEQIAKIPSYL